ncbi:MAG: hypothetical protein J6W29_04280, partial [Neisseriaceae bacterium]|nr:hypothetical protein [Neisseriaceae bacterium]
MNKQYRVIFNHQRNQFVVVSEDTHAHGKSSCKSSVSSVVGEVTLCAVAAVSAIGASFMPTTAAADTFNVTSGTNYSSGSTNGTYNNNFFRPGKTSTLAGSAGFFDAQGETAARDIVTGANSSSWYNQAKTYLGETGDATNLQNMLRSVDIVSKANELRAKNGLGELKISDTMMAMGQIRANYSASVKYDHAPDLGDLFSLGKATAAAGENLATDHRCPTGYTCGKYMANTDDLVEAAFYAWYDAEKADYLAQNGGQTGHYLAIINSNYGVTGAGYTDVSGQDKKQTTLVQEFGGDTSEPTYTPDEYKALLENYINTGWVFYNEKQTVNVTGDASKARVAAGYAIKGLDATGNTLNVDNATGTAYGGYAVSGNTSDNTVNVNAVVGIVYGGYSENNQATHNNTVNINKNAVAGNVYLANSGTVSGTVNFLGGTVGNLKAFETNGTATNAVLNIGATSKNDNTRTPMNTLKATEEVGGFNTYNFYLPDSVQNGDWALSADKANLTNATVNAYLSGTTNLQDKDVIHLITTQNGITGKPTKGTVQVGVTLQLENTLAVNGNDLDLSFTDPNAPQPPVVIDPKEWNILTNTTYTTDTQADPVQIFSGAFNAAKNTADATINVEQNADYKGLNINGSDKDGLTLNINQAKNLGDVNTGTGNLKTATISNSEINNLTATSGIVSLSNTTVKGVVNVENADVLTIKNGSVAGKITSTADQTTIGTADNNVTTVGNVEAAGQELTIVGKKTTVNGNVVSNGKGAETSIDMATVSGSLTVEDNKQLTIHGAKTGDVSTKNTQNVSIINGANIGNLTSKDGVVQMSDSTAKAVKADNASVNVSQVTVDSIESVNGKHKNEMTLDNSTVKGSLTVQDNVALVIGNKSTVGNITANNTETITLDGSTVKGAVNAGNVNTMFAGNSTVQGAVTGGGQSTLEISAEKGSLKADSVTGWNEINFAHLSDKHAALQITGSEKADFGNKINLSDSLENYNDGKKYTLIDTTNGVTVNDRLFAQNTRTGNEFDILSDAQYTVDEFGFHQNNEKTDLYINNEKTTKAISGKNFNAANGVQKAIININQAVDYNGLNVLGGGAGSVMNWTWGRNLGVIDGNGGTVNIGSADKATQMNQRTANNMVNVGSLNFYLPDNIKNGDWAVSLSSDKATDLSNTHITAYLSGDSNINDKDTVGLIVKSNGGAISVGSNNNVVVQQGVTATTTGQEIKLSDDALALNLVFNKNTTGGDTGGNTGGDTGGNTGGDTGGNTGGDTGGNTGGDTGGNTGGDTGGNTGGDTGGNTGG